MIENIGHAILILGLLYLAYKGIIPIQWLILLALPILSWQVATTEKEMKKAIIRYYQVKSDLISEKINELRERNRQ